MEKLEAGDRCEIIDAHKAKGNIGEEVHLVRFIPCYWDGKSCHETTLNIFNNTDDDAAWIVEHTVPDHGLEYVTAEGKVECGDFALIRASHLKLLAKASPAPAPEQKPVIHCG